MAALQNIYIILMYTNSDVLSMSDTQEITIIWCSVTSFTFRLLTNKINNDYVSLLCRQMSDIQDIIYLTNSWFSVQYMLYLSSVGVLYLFWNS